MSKVAICIPSYKNADFLKRLLDSVFIQTFENYVIVITDDSDTDEVKKVIEKYQSEKIYYYKNDKQLGATANCNRAMHFAQQFMPDYIKIMHHDDFFTFAYSLEKLVEMLDEDKKSVIAFSGTMQVNKKGSYERCILPKDVERLKDDCCYLYVANVIGAPSAVLVRNTEILMDEKLKWLVDLEWYMRILGENNHFSFTCEPLVSIGISEGQLTNECIADSRLQVKEYKYVYKKMSCLHREKYRKHLVKVMIKNTKFIWRFIK